MYTIDLDFIWGRIPPPPPPQPCNSPLPPPQGHYLLRAPPTPQRDSCELPLQARIPRRNFIHLYLGLVTPLNFLNFCPSVQAKVVDAEKTELEIDHTRSKYIPVATRTQLLFFCTTDLSNIDPMYQYSLEWFITIFLNSIASAERAGEVLMFRVSAIEFGSEGRYPAEFEAMAAFCLSLQPARFKVQRGCRVSYWMYRVHVHLWKNAFGCKMLSLLLNQYTCSGWGACLGV